MKKISYAWVILLAFLFPVIEDIIYYIRFNKISNDILIESLWFLPIGIVSGWILIYLLRKCKTKRGHILTFIGFIIGVAVSVPLIIYSGLFSTAFYFINIVGVIPPILGSLLGYGVSMEFS